MIKTQCSSCGSDIYASPVLIERVQKKEIILLCSTCKASLDADALNAREHERLILAQAARRRVAQ